MKTNDRNTEAPDAVDVRDGLQAFAAACRGLGINLVPLLVRTARWVHPDTFRFLPVWYPEWFRGSPRYDARWDQVKIRSRTGEKKAEPNIKAKKALKAALGIREKDWPNWTCCHIWSVDDPTFQRRNTVVQDPRFYSCIGNMVLLPTPLKALTDSVPQVKLMLRVCAWNLYGWVCEHPDLQDQPAQIKKGLVPDDYPIEWPLPGRRVLPPGVAPFTDIVRDAAQNRLTRIKQDLLDGTLRHFPVESVKNTLQFWGIPL